MTADCDLFAESIAACGHQTVWLAGETRIAIIIFWPTDSIFWPFAHGTTGNNYFLANHTRDTTGNKYFLADSDIYFWRDEFDERDEIRKHRSSMRFRTLIGARECDWNSAPPAGLRTL